MVLVLDGNAEIGAHLLSEIDNLICSRHLFAPSRTGNTVSELCINFCNHQCIEINVIYMIFIYIHTDVYVNL